MVIICLTIRQQKLFYNAERVRHYLAYSVFHILLARSAAPQEFEPQPDRIPFGDHDIISTAIRPLPQIQEGQLSVTLERKNAKILKIKKIQNSQNELISINLCFSHYKQHTDIKQPKLSMEI